MKIKVYRLNDQAARLQAAPTQRDWVKKDEARYAGLVLDDANSKGWELQSPYAFEATWNGGPDPDDIEIRLDDTQAYQPGFVQSHQGDGLLTLHTGYQFKTEGEHCLWVRGPINRPKDGLYPLESIVDTALLPCIITMTWKFTRPHQTIRFETGEPFCLVLPQSNSYIETCDLEVVRLEEELDVYKREFQQMVQSSAVHRIFAELGATGGAAASEQIVATTSETHEHLKSHPNQPVEDEDEDEGDGYGPFPPAYHVISPPEPIPDKAVAKLFKGHYPLKISVVLPSSNESVMLKRTVEQFVATLPDNSEIIVVDNGSTDGCADFLIEQKPKGVSLIQSAECLGVAGARNRGLEAAQGEVVVFSDAHMDLPERWWQPIIAALNEPNVGVVAPGIGQMGRPEDSTAWGQRIAEPSLRVEWLTTEPEAPGPVPTLGGGFMAMRHDTLKQAGAFDIGMPQWGVEDTEICVRYWLLGYEVWLVPKVRVLHYFRKENPYSVKTAVVTHNVLRLALLHFNQERLERVVRALKDNPEFGEALAYATDSDVLEQRALWATRRVRDDNWLFDRFKHSCSV